MYNRVERKAKAFLFLFCATCATCATSSGAWNLAQSFPPKRCLLVLLCGSTRLFWLVVSGSNPVTTAPTGCTLRPLGLWYSITRLFLGYLLNIGFLGLLKRQTVKNYSQNHASVSQSGLVERFAKL